MAAGGTADPDAPYRVSWRMTREPESAHAGRHTIRDLARKLTDSDDIADRAQGCASEVLANSVLHGSGVYMRVTVVVTATAFRVIVHDQGGTGLKPLPGQDDLTGERGDYGRGLLIVEELADDWQAVTRRGTTVWFEIKLPGQVPADGAA